MPNIKKLYKDDLVGKTFGDLFVKQFLGRTPLNKGNQTTPLWLCECVCGELRHVKDSRLKCGVVVSCISCGKVRTIKANSKARTGINTTVTKERLYRIWNAMRQRCNNPKAPNYRNYGAKGITVCWEWVSSYRNFRDWALGSGYEEYLTIDRKESSLGYYPDNCRWVTLRENSKEMCERHKKAGTGGFSEESYSKIRITNKVNLGCKFKMISGAGEISLWGCLIDCAEHICKVKDLKTAPLQIKKNISACLHNKRNTCHGYKFQFIEEF
jgi:hypothetical protein